MNTKRRLWIFALLILTALGVRLLISEWKPSLQQVRPRLSVRLDYSFDEVDYRELNEEGKPFIHLTTPHLKHDPEQSLAIATDPRLIVKQVERDWLITANSGEWQRNSEALQLQGEVVIASMGSAPPMRMESDELRYYAHNRDISAEGRVHLVRDRAEANGTGLNGNLISGKYQLLQDVEMTIHNPDS